MKLLILYHFGAGNTKLVAEILHSKLQAKTDVEIFPMEEIEDEFNFNSFDGFIIGFPTYNAHPSHSMIKFISYIKKLSEGKPAYIFTTC